MFWPRAGRGESKGVRPMRKHNLLRVAAATTVAVFMTVGGLGPVHAANDRADGRANGSDRGNSANAPEKHDPVTICHAKGNGDYVEITIDDDAYEAHVENHGDVAPAAEGGCPDTAGSDDKGKDEEKGDDKGGDKGNGGEGTVRVEVCHLVGNGSYRVIEFDDSALDAHLEHGDLYPVPEDGCPVPGDGGTVGDDQTGGETGAETDDQTGGETGGETGVYADEVLGTEAEAGDIGGAEVAGAAAANRAPAAVAPAAAASTAPAAGILPATGAGDYTVALLAGGALLAAGGVLIARRRLHAED